MKYNEKLRKLYGIDLKVVTERTFAPKLAITINNKSVYSALTREFIEDIKAQTGFADDVIDGMVDDEIEKHPEFKRQIRKAKINRLNEISNRR